MRALLLAAIVAGCSRAASPAVTAADPALADPLVGTTPPEWTAEAWLNSPPLTLASLRGHVVLVRWFMDDSCPYCSATAPALKQLDHDFRERGLVVVGMYHHKGKDPLTEAQYQETASRYGFRFAVARDPEWRTLKAWWLDGHDRDFTSVSFLLDKAGRIRGVHPGGRYALGDAAYASVRRAIEALLSE